MMRNTENPTLKFKCKHKGCTNSKHTGFGYCRKHYDQFKKHKKTFTVTRKDFNEVIDCVDHYELILTDLKMNENGRCKIDKKDLKKVKAVGRWGLCGSEGYVENSVTNILMHRLVMNAKENEEVDHKETGIKSRSDNRKSNLRISTHQENKFNQGKRKSNTSGFKGVSYHRRNGKWLAKIRGNGKQIHLGYFNTPEGASEAYNKAARELHKDFAHKSLLCEHKSVTTRKRQKLIRFDRK